ncbi:hypothetical protein [Paenibacillus humicus]|uniref:hypothetical protein n=1 Tax=Paenibacillus humicus TaxID=412861 RepID=UPI003F189140
MNPLDEMAAASDGENGIPTLRVLDLTNMVSTILAYVNQRKCTPLEKRLIAANLNVLLEQPDKGAEESA